MRRALASIQDGARVCDVANPVLSKLERFVALSDDDRALLYDVVATERKTYRGVDLIREGERPDHVHLVTQGFACRYKELTNGKRQIVAFLLPGDFCDLNAYILDEMDHGIATLAPAKIARIPKVTMERLLNRPSIARALFMTALVDAATLREWIANIGSRTAEQRIAHLFCELHARLCAVGLTSNNEPAAIPMTQVDLSQALGLSLVHTNKSMKKLRNQGLMRHKNGVLTILDYKTLSEMCSFVPNYLHLSESRER